MVEMKLRVLIGKTRSLYTEMDLEDQQVTEKGPDGYW